MELSLKDAVSILDVAKTLDWYSVWLWLSIIIPVYYVALRKIISEKQLPAIVDKETSNAPFSSGSQDKPTLFKRLFNFFTVPKIEPFFLYISISFFVIGTIVLIIGQKEKQRIRNAGWALKNYMANQHYYSMPTSAVIRETGISDSDLIKIKDQYPNEFSYIYTTNCNPTIIMVDSIPRREILKFSEKLLAAYLSNNAVLQVNGIKDFDALFRENNLFTYEVVSRLIVDSTYKYTFNLNPPGAQSRYVIVKRR